MGFCLRLPAALGAGGTWHSPSDQQDKQDPGDRVTLSKAVLQELINRKSQDFLLDFATVLG
jgi:hypothetical protein